MKSAAAYGSENADQKGQTLPSPSSSSGRIVASTTSLKQKKSRIAAAGATIGFIAACAVVGYTVSMQRGVHFSIPETEQLEVSARAATASTAFVTPQDESLYPTVEDLDVSPKDGVVTLKEYLNYLEAKKDADVAEVNAVSLPEDVKEDLIRQLNANYDSDGPCAVRAMKRIKKNGVILTKSNIKVLYYALDTFCPTSPVPNLQALIEKYLTPATNHVVLETPTGDTLAVDIPVNSGNGTFTGVVVNSPTGPTSVIVPVVGPGEPSTTIVVDTPTGPTVLEVPIKPLDKIDKHKEDIPALDLDPKDQALELEFEQMVTTYFADEAKNLEDTAVRADAEEKEIDAKNQLLDDCITKASNKFGWYGVYEESPHFDNAVSWVVDVCLLGLE